MRILFISNVFPNIIQPARGRFNYDLISELALDHQVKVIAPIPWVDWCKSWPGRPPLAASRDNTELEIYHPIFLYPPKLFRQAYGWFFWNSIRHTVHKILRTFAPDVVFGYWTHPDGEAAVRAARLAGCKAVVMAGGSDILVVTQNPQRKAAVAAVLQTTDLVVTVSNDLAARIARLGVAAEKIRLLRRGVRNDRFAPGCQRQARQQLGIGAGTRALLWAGRLVPVKGVDLLLRAAQILAQQSLPFHLYLVGEGPLRNSLHQQTRQAGLASQVTFVGSADHATLANWYRAADLFVLPSRSEGVPNVLWECSACELPFVAAQVGGIADAFAECTRWLVPPERPDLLADKIMEFFQTDPSVYPHPIPQSAAQSASQLLQMFQSVLASEKLPLHA